MADPTPMFSTLASLKATLRISAVIANTDADEQFDAAVRSARTHFWKELGLTRLAELIALPIVDPPVTDDDNLRWLAVEAERKFIRWELLGVYEAQFKEGSAAFQEWNDEGIFRGVNQFSISKIRIALKEEVDAALELLSDGDTSDSSEGRVETVGLDDEFEPPIVLGESLLPRGGIFRGLS